MPHLADQTLVAAHETTLERWKTEKPEQYYQLAEPVREEPIYEPLDPSPAEAAFYRERTEYLQSLPRFRIRDIHERHLAGAEWQVALVEDTERMSVYRGRVPKILGGAVDWPDDVLEFAQKHLLQELDSASTTIAPETSASGGSHSPSIFEVMPATVICDVRSVTRIDEYVLRRALEELQSVARDNLPQLFRERGVEELAEDHVVIDVDDDAVAAALAGYSTEAREAVALIHERAYSSPDNDVQSSLPL